MFPNFWLVKQWKIPPFRIFLSHLQQPPRDFFPSPAIEDPLPAPLRSAVLHRFAIWSADLYWDDEATEIYEQDVHSLRGRRHLKRHEHLADVEQTLGTEIREVHRVQHENWRRRKPGGVQVRKPGGFLEPGTSIAEKW